MMMYFNIQSMLFFMMFISINFSMQKNDYIRTFTPELLEEIKKQIYPTEEAYQNELKQMRTEMLLTWKDDSDDMKGYHHQVVTYIPDLSDYVVYEIEWAIIHLIPEARTQIVFFINPTTQKSRIFHKNPTAGTMDPIGYGGITEFWIHEILHYPIAVKTPVFRSKDYETISCRTKKYKIFYKERYSIKDTINESKKELHYRSKTYINYQNEKFYVTDEVTNEQDFQDFYVFTLENLCPKILTYMNLSKLKQMTKYKLYTNRAFKYIEYKIDENQNTTSDQNHQLQNTTFNEKQPFLKKETKTGCCNIC